MSQTWELRHITRPFSLFTRAAAYGWRKSENEIEFLLSEFVLLLFLPSSWKTVGWLQGAMKEKKKSAEGRKKWKNGSFCDSSSCSKLIFQDFLHVILVREMLIQLQNTSSRSFAPSFLWDCFHFTNIKVLSFSSWSHWFLINSLSFSFSSLQLCLCGLRVAFEQFAWNIFGADEEAKLGFRSWHLCSVR